MSLQQLEISSIVLDEDGVLTLAELCRYSASPAEHILTLIEHGIIEPHTLTSSSSSRWQFAGTSLVRVQTVKRLQCDLGVNLEGAALALELLDEVKTLRQQLAALRHQLQDADSFYD